MEWNRSDVIGLAKQSCVYCEGTGLRLGPEGPDGPCNCVLRGIFRTCYTRFRKLADGEKFISKTTLEPSSGKDSARSWVRRHEDYLADFCLVSKRSLTESEHKLFRFHFLLGAEWKLCCRQLNIDRGIFFHSLYRIEEKLGRVFRELKPFSLYPLDEYFGGTVRKARACSNLANVVVMQLPAAKHILRPPVRKIA